MSVNGPSESGDPSTEKTDLEDNHQIIYTHLLKALSERAGNVNGDVIYFREVSNFRISFIQASLA